MNDVPRRPPAVELRRELYGADAERRGRGCRRSERHPKPVPELAEVEGVHRAVGVEVEGGV